MTNKTKNKMANNKETKQKNFTRLINSLELRNKLYKKGFYFLGYNDNGKIRRYKLTDFINQKIEDFNTKEELNKKIKEVLENDKQN